MDETIGEWAACRELYFAIRDFHGERLSAQVLGPWLRTYPQVARWLRELAARGPDPAAPLDLESSWTLYALSRVNDLLLQPLQPERGGADEPAPAWSLSLAEYRAFMAALGLRELHRPGFSAFHHEIVEVVQVAYPASAAVLLRERWPCLMLGDMLFSRAGVDIAAGVGHVRADTVARAELYWAFLRRHRRARDLSHGWGSNSQWRTEFRRDFHVGGEYRFNVDGRERLDLLDEDAVDEDFGLTRRERIELVVHRMFVTTTDDRDGLFPYDDSFVCDERHRVAPVYLQALPAPAVADGEAGAASGPFVLPWPKRWNIAAEPERRRAR